MEPEGPSTGSDWTWRAGDGMLDTARLLLLSDGIVKSPVPSSAAPSMAFRGRLSAGFAEAEDAASGEGAPRARFRRVVGGMVRVSDSPVKLNKQVRKSRNQSARLMNSRWVRSSLEHLRHGVSLN